jgi:DNA-binding NarL/FixJ family response regulator
MSMYSRMAVSLLDAAKHATANPFVGEFGEPALDQVDTRAVGGREVNVEAWALSEPLPDDGRFVSSVIVDDEMDIQSGRYLRFDRVEELAELQRAMAVVSRESGVIGVLSLDNHPLLREGLAALIQIQSDMQLIGGASNGRQALEQFRTHHPGITLMDLPMPEMGGIDAISAIRGEFPDAQSIVLTTHAGDIQISRALKASARGYLLKGMLRQELLPTIRAVQAGQKRLSAEATAEIAEHATDDVLTPREIDILRLIANGNANKEIAGTLSLTEETVKGHVKNILSKLGVNDRTHGVTIALKRGLIDL